jgi:hypothetical protein
MLLLNSTNSLTATYFDDKLHLVQATLLSSKSFKTTVPVHTIFYARSNPFGEPILDTTIILYYA